MPEGSLLYNTANRGHTTALATLLAEGADPSWTDSFGLSPLLIAARKGHLKCCRHLIAAGAVVDSATCTGETPLMAAAKANNDCCVITLLEAGADVRRSDNDQRTALDLCERRFVRTRQVLQSWEEALAAAAQVRCCASGVFFLGMRPPHRLTPP